MTLSIGVLLAVPAGWFQTRPATAAQNQAMADYLARPAAHQVCEVHDGVRYCAYRDHRDAIDVWRTPVEAVLARLPDAARRRELAVVQRPETTGPAGNCGRAPDLDTLPDPVARRLTPEQLWPADGQVHPGFEWPDQFTCAALAHGLFVAVQTGAWAVGLPPAPWDDHRRCTADGQARSLAALWLGAQTSPGAADALRSMDSPATDDGQGHVDGPMWGVTWHRAELRGALALLDRPAADVGAVLAAHWDRWVDPATPSAELLAAVGLAPSTANPVPVSGDCP